MRMRSNVCMIAENGPVEKGPVLTVPQKDTVQTPDTGREYGVSLIACYGGW
jgi:hypothetical protein